MQQALQAVATKGEEGGLMTSAEALDTFLVFRTHRFGYILIICSLLGTYVYAWRHLFAIPWASRSWPRSHPRVRKPRSLLRY